MKDGQHERWMVLGGLLLAALPMVGCDSSKGSGATDKAEPTVQARDLTPDAKTGSPSKVSAGPEVPAPAEKQGATSPSTYSCSDDSIWTKKEFKALQDGALESLNEGIAPPTFDFATCYGVENCESLKLSENQKLLTVGQYGNDLKLVVRETCGENSVIFVVDEKGASNGIFRGKDMTFETAVVGGDRFLLGGFARHKSETAKDGFVPREYLVSGRQGEFEKLEPARNKQLAVPVAAASQIVQVKTERGLCTTMFWKLGVEQCDFEGPNLPGSVLVGSQMIFLEAGKAMKWNPKDGPSELLPALEWITTDGVNVLWSTGDHLFMTQPRWDLPELKSEPLDGGSGEKPAAFGCGRSLTKSAQGYHLRNLKMGNEWVLPAGRFGGELTAPVVMNCDVVLAGDGKKFALKDLGSLRALGEATSKAAVSGEGAALPPADPAATQPGTAAPGAE